MVKLAFIIMIHRCGPGGSPRSRSRPLVIRFGVLHGAGFGVAVDEWSIHVHTADEEQILCIKICILDDDGTNKLDLSAKLKPSRITRIGDKGVQATE